MSDQQTCPRCLVVISALRPFSMLHITIINVHHLLLHGAQTRQANDAESNTTPAIAKRFDLCRAIEQYSERHSQDTVEEGRKIFISKG